MEMTFRLIRRVIPNERRSVRGAGPNGDNVDITFEDDARGCRYDLRVVYDDDDDAVWADVDLCQLSKIHIYWDKKAGVTRATSD